MGTIEHIQQKINAHSCYESACSGPSDCNIHCGPLRGELEDALRARITELEEALRLKFERVSELEAAIKNKTEEREILSKTLGDEGCHFVRTIMERDGLKVQNERMRELLEEFFKWTKYPNTPFCDRVRAALSPRPPGPEGKQASPFDQMDGNGRPLIP